MNLPQQGISTYVETFDLEFSRDAIKLLTSRAPGGRGATQAAPRQQAGAGGGPHPGLLPRRPDRSGVLPSVLALLQLGDALRQFLDGPVIVLRTAERGRGGEVDADAGEPLP
jgi:hypothetical protein